MRPLFVAFALCCATAAQADWYFEASLEGGAVFWTYTNDTGEVSPLRQKNNEIWITRTDMVQELGETGNCTFSNCSVTVYLDGVLPAPGEMVTLSFSNGDVHRFQGTGMEDALNNNATVGMGTTNGVYNAVRAASWVDVSFGQRSHRFSLAGSTAALDQIQPYLP